MEKITHDNLPSAVSQLYDKLENIENLLLEKNNQHQPEADELLTVQETAKFLNLSIATIYGKISRNELPFMKKEKSKRVYFSKIQIFDFLKTGRVQTVSEIEAEAGQYLKIKGGKKS